MTEHDGLGIPLEDSVLAKKQVERAWSDATERLFTKLDDIQEEFDLSESQIQGLATQVLGADVGDEYAEWCDGA